MRMTGFRAALLAAGIAVSGAAAVAAIAPAHAQQGANLTGDWRGGYASSVSRDSNAFEVKLRQTGGALSGTITEVNTFGDPEKAMFLTSTLTGTANGAAVRFTKTYDGSGGVSHSVIYEGRIDSTGRRIRGTYNAGGTGGQFEMVR